MSRRTLSPTLHDFLRGTVSQYGSRPAIEQAGVVLSYQALQQAIDALAQRLSAAGVGAGHLVAIDFENGPNYVIALFAVLSTGAVCVPLHASLAEREKLAIIDASGADCLLRQSAVDVPYPCPVWRPFDAASALEPPASIALRREREVDELAIILYTSGSTGAPKGAALSHANLLLNALLSAQTLALRASDRVLAGVPFSHAYGQNRCVLSPLLSGAAVICPREHSIPAIQAALSDAQITLFVAVPATYTFLLNARQPRPAQLRAALSGAAPLAATLQQRVTEKFGVPLLTAYGSTETSPVIASQRLDEPLRYGSVGRPLPGITIDIRRSADAHDAHDAPNASTSKPAAGQTGELFVRGHNVMQGYWDGQRPNPDSLLNGWYATGDLVHLDADGVLSILGRKSDMIKKFGHRIFPAEIEAVLLAHPAIQDCLVQKQASSFAGDDVQALVVLKDGASTTAAELQAFCRAGLAEYKVPAQFVFVSELPVTATGKAKRVA